MNKAIYSFFLLLTIIAFSQQIFACTCEIEPIRKAFRKSKAVFIGKAISIDDKSLDKNNFYPFEVTFKVKKSWKGAKEDKITVKAAYPNSFENQCISFKIEKGNEYMIFARTDKLLVKTECSNSYIIERDDKFHQKNVKKLDSFWFRLWTKIYPF